MPESYLTTDLISFQRQLFAEWYLVLDNSGAVGDFTALEPDACADFEYERRKNEVVRLLVANQASGAGQEIVFWDGCFDFSA